MHFYVLFYEHCWCSCPMCVKSRRWSSPEGLWCRWWSACHAPAKWNFFNVVFVFICFLFYLLFVFFLFLSALNVNMLCGKCLFFIFIRFQHCKNAKCMEQSSSTQCHTNSRLDICQVFRSTNLFAVGVTKSLLTLGEDFKRKF